MDGSPFMESYIFIVLWNEYTSHSPPPNTFEHKFHWYQVSTHPDM